MLWLHLLQLGLLRRSLCEREVRKGGGEIKGASVVYYVNIHIHILFAQSKSKFQREIVRERLSLFGVVVTLALAPHQYTVRGSYKNQTQKKKYTKKETERKI